MTMQISLYIKHKLHHLALKVDSDGNQCYIVGCRYQTRNGTLQWKSGIPISEIFKNNLVIQTWKQNLGIQSDNNFISRKCISYNLIKTRCISPLVRHKDSPVIWVTGCRPGFNYRQGHSPSIKWLIEALCLVAQQLNHEADCSLLGLYRMNVPLWLCLLFVLP